MYPPYGFTALTGQNAASTQAKNMRPTMPGYTGLDSVTFDQMRTPEDQIHWLYLYCNNIDSRMLTAEQVQALIDAANETLKNYVDRQDDALADELNDIQKDTEAKYQYLLSLIEELTEFNGSTIDPTKGILQPIKSVIENVYDFDRPFAVTAHDYDMVAISASYYDRLGIVARDFDICFALLTYNVYQQYREGVAIARDEDTLILI